MMWRQPMPSLVAGCGLGGTAEADRHRPGVPRLRCVGVGRHGQAADFVYPVTELGAEVVAYGGVDFGAGVLGDVVRLCFGWRPRFDGEVGVVYDEVTGVAADPFHKDER